MPDSGSRVAGDEPASAAAAPPRPEPLKATPIERLIIALVSFAIAIGAIAALSGFFAGQDAAGVAAKVNPGLGQAFRDQGATALAPGQRRPHYDSNPPTSGPHIPEPVLLDEARLSVDQLLEALELGDVVIFYGTRRPPYELTALANRLADAPFTPALAADGDAIILAPRPRTVGLIATAWAHTVRVSAPDDPLLSQFVNYWLGRGAPSR
jgi:hypothetical protein